MKKIKSFFKKVFNLIVSFFLAAVDLIIYIFAVIALYEGDYNTALLITLFGIAMEIRKGFSKVSDSIKLGNVKEIVNVIHKAATELSEVKNEKNG